MCIYIYIYTTYMCAGVLPSRDTIGRTESFCMNSTGP